MLHIGMRARLTLTVEPLVADPDATGIVEYILFDPREPAIEATPSVHTLQYMPLAVLFHLDDNDTVLLPPKYCETHANGSSEHDEPLLRQCPHCELFEGELYIVPQSTPKSFKGLVTIQTGHHRGAHTWNFGAKRVQLRLTIITACTLHTLQGTTADPGLIFHWVFPRRVSNMLRWLSVYVALSRPRSFAQLRSVGISYAIRKII
ncbi:hypothetical protein N9L19_00810 [bacterium]|nr:hypothetical protein [bacterium]